MIMVFLLGYIPSWLKTRSVQEQNSRLEYKLKLAELHGRLGMMSYEANRNNYANAAQFSTAFFSDLRKVADDTESGTLKQKVQPILSRRDEITANLAEPNPGVKEKLAQMYADFFQLMESTAGNE